MECLQGRLILACSGLEAIFSQNADFSFYISSVWILYLFSRMFYVENEAVIKQLYEEGQSQRS